MQMHKLHVYTVICSLHKKMMQLKICPSFFVSLLLYVGCLKNIRNVDFKVKIPTLIGQIMMQYLGFISYFKALLSHYKISFRKTSSGF